MRRALDLALLSAGATRPNPPVGAVIVRGRRIVGEGRHLAAGAPHAEIEALDAAGRNARQATLYVSLEPCSTTGRTGPCTQRILDAGIRRVVVAVSDPNPLHAGRGLRLLQKHGLSVELGCEAGRAAELLAPFAKHITCGLPHLTLKLAMSLDGKIADHTGRSRWISSPASRERVQELRRMSDAILIGAETARRDRPSLLPEAADRHPWRVVVDSSGLIDARAPVFCDPQRTQTILATTKTGATACRTALLQSGVLVWVLPSRGGHVSLRALMRRLGRMGVLQVLCEGGGELAASLIAERLVDDFYLFVAPKILGGRSAPGAVAGPGFRLDRAPEITITSCERLGPDLLIRARTAGNA